MDFYFVYPVKFTYVILPLKHFFLAPPDWFEVENQNNVLDLT